MSKPIFPLAPNGAGQKNITARRKNMYYFNMIGRRYSDSNYLGRKVTSKVVWIKGTIQVEKKDEECIKKLLEENMEKVLNLAHPNFHWRDVSLRKAVDSDKIGITIEDLELWQWEIEYDYRAFIEDSYSANQIAKLNSELSALL